MDWDLMQICRTCTRKFKNMLPIFESRGISSLSPADMLLVCASLQMAMDDNLPIFICQTCVEQLDFAYSFRMQCIDTDQHLREYLQVNYNVERLIDDTEHEELNLELLNSNCKSENELSCTEEGINVQSESNCTDYLKMQQNNCTITLEQKLNKLSNGPENLDNINQHNRETTSPIKNGVSIADNIFSKTILDGVDDEMTIQSTEALAKITPEHVLGRTDTKQENVINLKPKNTTLLKITDLSKKNKIRTNRATNLAVVKNSKQLCQICGKIFRMNQELIIHLRRHRGEKPLKCKYCEKGFLRTVDLRTHEARHVGESRYFCSTCGKGFFRRYMLTRHTRSHTGEKPYKCEICTVAFAQINDLCLHIRRHTGERFQCDLCDKDFLLSNALSVHKRKKHGLNIPRKKPLVERVNINNSIGSVFNESEQSQCDQLTSVSVSVPSSSNDQSLICRLCKEKFSNKYVLQKHMQDKHDIIERQHATADLYKNKCLDGCNASFSQKKHLIEHLNLVHLKDIKIEELEFENSDVFEMWLMNIQEQDHSDYAISQSKKKVKNGTKTYLDCCRSGMYIEKKIKKRKTKLQGSKKINRNCTSFMILFENTQNKKCLVTMCRTHYGHGVEPLSLSFKNSNLPEAENGQFPYDVRLICEICDEKLQTTDELNAHKLTMHDIEPKTLQQLEVAKFPCDRCDKSFVSEKNRENHVYVVHEKVMHCRNCNECFRGSEELNKHNTRNNECSKKYLCPYCGNRFRAENTLEIHLRRHRGVKPFKCKQCDKAFTCSFDLIKHEWRHGRKSFVCVVCEKGFLSNFKLNEHFRIHIGEKPYECSICAASFSQIDFLDIHMRQHMVEKFSCGFCEEEFQLKQLRDSHEQQKHSTKREEFTEDQIEVNTGVLNEIKTVSTMI